MFFVEEFERLSAQMHESEAKLEEALAAEKEEMTALHQKREEKENKVKKKREKVEEAVSDLNKEEAELNEIEKNIAILREFEENEKKKNVEDIDCLVERVVKKLKIDPHLIGKCIAISEIISLELICPVCGKICSESNPKVIICSSNKTEEGDSLDLPKKCLRCAKTKEVKIDGESKKKMKNLNLINQMIRELQSLSLIRERKK